jgi:hypothetical protein
MSKDFVDGPISPWTKWKSSPDDICAPVARRRCCVLKGMPGDVSEMWSWLWNAPQFSAPFDEEKMPHGQLKVVMVPSKAVKQPIK